MRLKTATLLHTSVDITIVLAAIGGSASVWLFGQMVACVIVASFAAFTFGMHVLWVICGGCPITHIENSLRVAAGGKPYSEDGCVTDFLRWLISPAVPSWTGKAVSYGVMLMPALVGGVRLVLI